MSTAQPGSYATLAAVLELGRLSLAFGRVDRITYHPDGETLESDTDHTVMLGLIGCAFAAEHLPDLDVGLIAQYALVHDLVEVYAGDTPTLRALSAADKAGKEEREHEAFLTLETRFCSVLPWLPRAIAEYERRNVAEARYVKAMDKMLPKITHVLNNGITFAAQGMERVELEERYRAQLAELRAYAADFPPLFDLREALLHVVLLTLEPGAS